MKNRPNLFIALLCLFSSYTLCNNKDEHTAVDSTTTHEHSSLMHDLVSHNIPIICLAHLAQQYTCAIADLATIAGCAHIFQDITLSNNVFKDQYVAECTDETYNELLRRHDELLFLPKNVIQHNEQARLAVRNATKLLTQITNQTSGISGEDRKFIFSYITDYCLLNASSIYKPLFDGASSKTIARDFFTCFIEHMLEVKKGEKVNTTASIYEYAEIVLELLIGKLIPVSELPELFEILAQKLTYYEYYQESALNGLPGQRIITNLIQESNANNMCVIFLNKINARVKDHNTNTPADTLKLNTALLEDKYRVALSHITGEERHATTLTGIHIWDNTKETLYHRAHHGNGHGAEVTIELPVKRPSTSMLELAYNRQIKVAILLQRNPELACESRKISTFFPGCYYTNKDEQGVYVELIKFLDETIKNPYAYRIRTSLDDGKHILIGKQTYYDSRKHKRIFYGMVCIKHDLQTQILPTICTAYPCPELTDRPTFFNHRHEKIQLITDQVSSQRLDRIHDEITKHIMQYRSSLILLNDRLISPQILTLDKLIPALLNMNLTEAQTVLDPLYAEANDQSAHKQLTQLTNAIKQAVYPSDIYKAQRDLFTRYQSLYKHLHMLHKNQYGNHAQGDLSKFVRNILFILNIIYTKPPLEFFYCPKEHALIYSLSCQSVTGKRITDIIGNTYREFALFGDAIFYQKISLGELGITFSPPE